MKWTLIVMLWANVQQPLPEEEWGGRAYLKWYTDFRTYEACIDAKDKVVESLYGPDRANIACIPRAGQYDGGNR